MLRAGAGGLSHCTALELYRIGRHMPEVSMHANGVGSDAPNCNVHDVCHMGHRSEVFDCSSTAVQHLTCVPTCAGLPSI